MDGSPLSVVELKTHIMWCAKDAEYTHRKTPFQILRTGKTNLYY